ncbi:MAG: hypothetical protein A3F83_04925 [Candidatus Glassbacteria bacterium RIFCSPLOWO2_12_FULL_58_11]|uniref:ABC transporter domain-containing protein n=1 Tax=Candidatus Glassbacteria bacterium RIFCSPLOWO2_12_FULL_58_11 TaxID=1817867 RepID=A0A1F5Z159_9BACT|nr:MAG: hypothetical protein A3F83_04925 [Candidatus Glassbacteria bacterium RIFCSPLOWO2_12_FULL_58_11]
MSADSKPLVECRGLVKTFRLPALAAGPGSREFRAVDGLSLAVYPGETLALVGESGCGKSTTGRLLLRLEKPSAGTVTFEGRDLAALSAARLRTQRSRMQMIFQDPYGSLNPRLTVGAALAEPLRIHWRLSGKSLRERIAGLLENVGLRPEHARRYPHEFSGGQRQRIAIARAVSVNPGFVVADEPVSSLDISIQGQILKLLIELKKSLGMAMLFISHDLAVVRQISDRVAVMYRGRLVELAPAGELFSRPLHPYTRLLLSCVLAPRPGRKGAPPDIRSPEATGYRGFGCSFAGRCPLEIAACTRETPELRELYPDHYAACLVAGGKPLPDISR